MILRYEGSGTAHIPGIPARDLTSEDMDAIVKSYPFNDENDAISQLTAHGLYSAVKKKPQKTKTVISEDKS